MRLNSNNLCVDELKNINEEVQQFYLQIGKN